jgi:hypothetical protein
VPVGTAVELLGREQRVHVNVPASTTIGCPPRLTETTFACASSRLSAVVVAAATIQAGVDGGNPSASAGAVAVVFEPELFAAPQPLAAPARTATARIQSPCLAVI